MYLSIGACIDYGRVFYTKPKYWKATNGCFASYLAVTLLGKMSQNWHSVLAGNLS